MFSTTRHLTPCPADGQLAARVGEITAGIPSFLPFFISLNHLPGPDTYRASTRLTSRLGSGFLFHRGPLKPHQPALFPWSMLAITARSGSADGREGGLWPRSRFTNILQSCWQTSGSILVTSLALGFSFSGSRIKQSPSWWDRESSI